ncbi:aldo/keto reductase [Oryzibacter oryziterrae]|uniref:aldo/keto reductase n=1 Tax=Oryzibacter oryziterrae TaxID=2766474 RepID=UPI001F28BA48|nr:aldo/keto reductase [Oryzibacter oryziterrae]
MPTSSLPTRPLGRTGFDITPVGLGAWAIGGADWTFGWGPQDDAQSIATIRHAVERGVNWIDTAPIYGLGHSEEIVRRALAEIPQAERPYVFTKAGLEWDGRSRKAYPKFIASPRRLKKQVEASLTRLGVETIDLLQIHWPPRDGTEIEEYWAALVDLKQAGKLRAIGLSNHDVGALERAERVGHVDTLQPPFSALTRGVAAAELPWCQNNETGVIVYSPLQNGLLTGAFSADRVAALPADDWRKQGADFVSPALERNLAFVEALKPIARRRDSSVAAVAIAWVLAWPGVSGAIVGARRPEQIDGWLDGATLSLTVRDFFDISKALDDTGAGTGPTHPHRLQVAA